MHYLRMNTEIAALKLKIYVRFLFNWRLYLKKAWSRQKETADIKLEVFMVEMSGIMRNMQFKNLIDKQENDDVQLYEPYKTKHSSHTTVTWISDINELPEKEAVQLFLANEFFDALPVHKFQVSLIKMKKVLFKLKLSQNLENAKRVSRDFGRL